MAILPRACFDRSMSLITTQEAATRLARAILGDIVLYNEEKLLQREDMSEEVQEGRALYQSRTDALLHDLYERELAASRIAQPTAAPAPELPPPAAALPVRGSAQAPAQGANLLWIALGLIGLAALGLWRLLRPQDW